MSKPLGRCTYCLRDLTSPHSRCGTAATRDHVMPKCVGGTRKVPCCQACNSLKGDIHPGVWRWFTEKNPGWWRIFKTNREVIEACREVWGCMVRASVTGRAPRSDFELGGVRLAGNVVRQDLASNGGGRL
jgi:hypothetical protein